MTENNNLRSNECLSYMMYMANKWNKDEAVRIYGECLGNHIWNKYLDYYDAFGIYGAYAKLVYELDEGNLDLLLTAACKKYNGRRNR